MKTKVIICHPNDLQTQLQNFFNAKHAERVDIEILNTQQTFLPGRDLGDIHAPRLVYTMIYTETSWDFNAWQNPDAEYVEEKPERELTQEDFNRWQNPDAE